MPELSAKPTAPTRTVNASTPRGPWRSARLPTANAARPPTTRLIVNAIEIPPRLQPKACDSSGRNTPKAVRDVETEAVTAKSATTTTQRGDMASRRAPS